jgi:very-short-patch-repair endonuclease
MTTNSDKNIEPARNLRQREAYLERELWRRLRNRETSPFKFRRQHPVGPYVVDFACPEAKLAIEIDGPHHEQQRATDEFRTDRLRDHGYEVVRFKTPDAVDDVGPLVEAIINAVNERINSTRS